jgi:glycosyltransferase involved in cell wall biosynthesis
MRVAIQARDLDHNRIDGTRVYLKQLLERFGALAPEVDFTLYHRDIFNHRLTPHKASNYTEKRLPGRLAWMQTSFALEMFRVQPDRVFLPLQAAPLFFPKKPEIIATIHDLAFQFYPETFPLWHRFKLKVFLRILLWRAKKIICVSHATKRDLLHFFPWLPPELVRVIHHGFDATFFEEVVTKEQAKSLLDQYGLKSKKYLLYVGALQPRKNIIRTIEAFEYLKKSNESYTDWKLVLTGEAAWLSKDILKRAETSPYTKDIILTGGVDFEALRTLYQYTALFIFPSLYEGFGLPILEAFASKVPVLVSENSSLREVAGEGAWYCDAFDAEDIARQIIVVLSKPKLQEELIAQSQEQLKKFSWDRSAQETLDFILSEH